MSAVVFDRSRWISTDLDRFTVGRPHEASLADMAERERLTQGDLQDFWMKGSFRIEFANVMLGSKSKWTQDVGSAPSRRLG
jgi:hypothetical protein